ncbi:MerR family transcriptional regulator [Aneurinibacillus sp. Ricciae_BoGa-3]|uniref:MerR family transcriptional regulator n=1 Tax=Aneurinibacillus sp. Ricciae_BoGa-3 TaxID=3022697 RepID=UPI0023413AC9|nr:MerR family transcriptional regulator [Aneurinibacillus sp. Ricciae_BoGa-3]WCK52463.1 MerR family transcriptional regulator [Aneurinibacillus sp. Ricciae_BoGa-3]
MNKELTIQKMAEIAGMSAHTLRYYEKVGLIVSVKRLPNGYRLYSEKDIAWVEFLHRLRATGMSIRQMQAFAELRYRGDETVSERTELLEAHYEEVLKSIKQLKENAKIIEAKIEHYRQMKEELSDGKQKPI